jgi:hypothetical protein
VVHFVSKRDPRDRGFYEREGSIPLPADFELSEDADEFEVLCRQIHLGGLVPGWPDAIGRRCTPLASVLAQSAAKVDFAKRFSCCGVALPRSDFERAGAFSDVFPGRPDMLFDDLLGWDVRSGCAGWIEFRAIPDGQYDSLLCLPLYTPASPFVSIGLMVDDDEQAQIIQDILTTHFLGLTPYGPAHRAIRRQLMHTFILSPAAASNPELPLCELKGLESFATRQAVVPTEAQLRMKVHVDRAISGAREAILPYLYPRFPDEHPSYVAFTPVNDDLSKFLTDTGRASFAERSPVPGDWRLELDVGEVDCPYLEFAAASLKSSLKLDFYVGKNCDQHG